MEKESIKIIQGVEPFNEGQLVSEGTEYNKSKVEALFSKGGALGNEIRYQGKL